MNILIIGGTNFIGSALAKRLSNSGLARLAQLGNDAGAQQVHQEKSPPLNSLP
jgi:nucleoside-diphosphate-sugar epimerase